MGQVLLQLGHPDRVLHRLWGEEYDPLVLVQYETFEEHQPDVGLAEADPVAQERPSVLTGDAHHRPVGLLLVAVELWEHLRVMLVPITRSRLQLAEH